MTTLLGRALRDAFAVKASRNSLSSYVLNAPHQFGQPPLMQAQFGYAGLTPQRMREIILKTPTAGGAFNAILDFASGTGMGVRNVDHAKKVSPAQAAAIKSLMSKPNPQQTWRRFTRSLMRDILTFGYAGVEVEQTNSNIPNLHVIDTSKIKVDFDETGKIVGFNLLNQHGVPVAGTDGVHTWQPNEVVWFVLDEESSTLYGTSRTVQLYACGVLESLMLAYIGGKFNDSNVPYGVLNLGDISDDELKSAIEVWNSQAENRAQHRIILTGSKDAFNFVEFGDKLRDLDATNLLVSVRSMIMGILGVTANELGESQDVNKSNGYNLSFVFKKRAIEPLLKEITDTLTSQLLHRLLGMTDLEFYFEEIDSRDELLASQIDDLQLRQGTASINQIRNRRGLSSLDMTADEPMVFTGSAWIPVSMVPAFAKAQLDGLLLLNKQMQVGIAATIMQMQQGTEGGSTPQLASISPPLIRPPQEPERMTTPDGKGSTTAKVMYPKPLTGKPASGGTNPQKTRGPVQTMRQQGMRKEDMAA